jgi:hypothetical protein
LNLIKPGCCQQISNLLESEFKHVQMVKEAEQLPLPRGKPRPVLIIEDQAAAWFQDAYDLPFLTILD